MKKVSCILLAAILCISLNGCYDSKEISRIAFVIAVGFDEGSYSFQIVKPSAFEGNGTDSSPLLTTTIKASNVYIAMDKLNSAISEKCDYSHIKLVLFSKEKLKNGIEKELDAMLKSNDFHPNTRIAMCNESAAEYMAGMEIPLDANPAEYYENIFKKNFTEYSPDVKLKDMQKSYKTQVIGNVLPVMSKDSNGMAITKNHKLVSTAESEEVLLYKMLKNRNFEGNYPIDNNAVVNIKEKRCRYSVDLSDQIPIISVKILLEGNITWAEENIDKTKFSEQVKEKLENDITEFLYRCSNKYKADILDFYKLAKTNYLTTESWENEDWQGLFEKANYDVTVEAEIKREGININ